MEQKYKENALMVNCSVTFTKGFSLSWIQHIVSVRFSLSWIVSVGVYAHEYWDQNSQSLFGWKVFVNWLLRSFIETSLFFLHCHQIYFFLAFFLRYSFYFNGHFCFNFFCITKSENKEETVTGLLSTLSEKKTTTKKKKFFFLSGNNFSISEDSSNKEYS